MATMASPGSPGEKRTEGVLSWEEYFMSVAYLSAQRSKDPVTQVGACIVNKDKRIVGVGYNGMPNNCSDELLPWGKESEDTLKTKKLYVCHAEMNAIINKYEANIKGCRMYTTLYPCNECAKLIIQSGIGKVIYLSDKHHDKEYTRAADHLFKIARVKARPYYLSARTEFKIKFERNISGDGEEQEDDEEKDKEEEEKGEEEEEEEEEEEQEEEEQEQEQEKKKKKKNKNKKKKQRKKININNSKKRKREEGEEEGRNEGEGEEKEEEEEEESGKKKKEVETV